MANARSLVIAALVLLAGGCGYDVATFGPSLVPRLDAAKAISNSAQRDNAIRIVAMEATQMGDAGVVNDAVDSLHDTHVRDEVAAYAARTFGEHARAGDATAIAKKIKNVALRDRVLGEIATGKD